MRQKSVKLKEPAEKVVTDIRRATRKPHSSEEKIRIVLEGPPFSTPQNRIWNAPGNRHSHPAGGNAAVDGPTQRGCCRSGSCHELPLLFRSAIRLRR
jgi:hypothetical protein